MSASLFTIHARFVATDWRELASRAEGWPRVDGGACPADALRESTGLQLQS